MRSSRLFSALGIIVFGTLVFCFTANANNIHGIPTGLSYEVWDSWATTTPYINIIPHTASSTTPAPSVGNMPNVYQNFELDCSSGYFIDSLKINIPRADRYDKKVFVRFGFTSDFGGYGFQYSSPYKTIGTITWSTSTEYWLTTPGWQTIPINYNLTCVNAVNIFQIYTSSGDADSIVNPVFSLVSNGIIGGSEEVYWDSLKQTVSEKNDGVWYNATLTYPEDIITTTNPGLGFDLEYYFDGTGYGLSVEEPQENSTSDTYVQVSGTCPATVGFKISPYASTTEQFFSSTCTDHAWQEYLYLDDGFYTLTATSTPGTVVRHFQVRHGSDIYDPWGELASSSTAYGTSTEGGILQTFISNFVSLRPFSYVRDLIVIMQDALQEPTTTSYTLPSSLITVTSTSAYFNFNSELINASTFTSIVPQNAWDALRPILVLGLYVMFGFYLFDRTRDLL